VNCEKKKTNHGNERGIGIAKITVVWLPIKVNIIDARDDPDFTEAPLTINR